MSDSGVKKKKKSKKAKKEHKVKTPPESESSDEELDLTKECHPIAHYIDDRAQMVAEMFSVIKGGKLKSMLPPVLKDYDVEKLKLKCLDQLLGMSEKRIISILDGEILESSSESDVNTDESDESEASQSEDQSSDSSSHSRRKRRKPVKPEPVPEPKQPEKQHNLWNPEDPNPPPETQGKTLLEILELEMRARAIRAMLKQHDVPEKSGPSKAQPVISAEVDLTEDDYPSVVKKEIPSEQELDFTERLQKSAKTKKQQPPANPPSVRPASELSEQELRNRLIKKKTYRTRQQRLENIEPEVPPEPEQTVEPEKEPLSDPDIIPIEVVKKEPTEIILDDPEEGELSSDGEEAPVVVKQEPGQTTANEAEKGQEASKEKGVERITAMDGGEFLANTDVELPSTNEADEEENNFIELFENDEDLSAQSRQDEGQKGSQAPPDVFENPELVTIDIDADDVTVTELPVQSSVPIEAMKSLDNLELETQNIDCEDIVLPVQTGITEVQVPQNLAPSIQNVVDPDLLEIGEPVTPSIKKPDGGGADIVLEIGDSVTANIQKQDGAGAGIILEIENSVTHNVRKPDDAEIILEIGDSVAPNIRSLDDPEIIEVRVSPTPTRRRSKSELAQELKQIEEQIDRRTQQPLIVENVFPASDCPTVNLSNVVVLKIGRKGQELQEYVISSSAEPPVYDISDSEDFDDDDIMIIEDETATKELVATQNNPADSGADADRSTWRSRWLSKDKVQKVVKSSKICALVRKRLKSKKAALKAQKSTESEPAAETETPVVAEPVAEVSTPAPLPVIEGSVSEYEQIFGKKVVETETIVQEWLNEILDRLESEESASRDDVT